MEKILVWGTGQASLNFINKCQDSLNIIAFIDNDEKKHGTICKGAPILSPSNALNLDYTELIIASTYNKEIEDQAEELGFDRNRIYTTYKNNIRLMKKYGKVDPYPEFEDGQNTGMRILLVAPRNGLMSQYYFPLGIAYISSILKENDFNVFCHNNAIEDDPEAAFREVINIIRPDVIGIGALTPSYNDIKVLVDISKEMLPNVPIVLGGGVLSSEPEIFNSFNVDVGVVGEGEITSLELFEALEHNGDLSNIPGLLFKTDSGKIFKTAERQPISDLDLIPIPDYEGFNYKVCQEQTGTIEIIASRGCPFHCSFCWSALGRGKYRVRSLDNLFLEIEYLINTYQVTFLGIMDELFALKPERVSALCKRIKPYGITWYTQVRVDSINKKTLLAMRDAGCFYVFYGFESMSPAILKSMNKKILPEQIEEACELTYRAKINIFGNFIFGDPMETEESANHTLRWWLDNRKYFINLGKIDCWPGTRLYQDAVKRRIIRDKIGFIKAGCPTINMTHEDDDVFERILHRLWALHEGLMVWPAKLLKIIHTRLEGCDAFMASCICPHCVERATFENLLETKKLSTQDRDGIRVHCPHCNRLYDIPARISNKNCPNEITIKFKQGLELADKGLQQEAVELFIQVKNDLPSHQGAWLELGNFWLSNEDPETAYQNYRHSSRYICLNPEGLKIFGMILMRRDEAWLADYYFKQAHILEKTTVPISKEPNMYPEPTVEEIAVLDSDPVFTSMNLSYTRAD